VCELDDAFLVLFVAGAEVEVDQQRGLLRKVTGDGRPHADAVADEIADGELGVCEGVVEAVSLGANFEGAALCGEGVSGVLESEGIVMLEAGGIQSPRYIVKQRLEITMRMR
jgi:hypothetical protein